MKRLIASLLILLLLAGCARDPSSPAPPSSSLPQASVVEGQGSLLAAPGPLMLGSEAIPALATGETQPDLDTHGRPHPLTTTTIALPPFSFADGTAEVGVTVYARGSREEVLFEGSGEDFPGFAPPANGSYEMLIKREWPENENGSFAGTAWYHLLVTYDLAPVLTLEGAPVKQGRTAYLSLRYLPEGQQAAQVSVTSSIGFTPTFYAYGDGMIALLPARYMLDKGTYHLTAAMGGKSWELDFVIRDGEFESEPPFTIPIGPGVDMSAANKEFNDTTGPLKLIGDPGKYWVGAFQPPLKTRPLRISSSFGYTRTINGNVEKHGGIDYAVPADTPVYAPNNGRVLYAGELQLTGNTVCIEHGFGLKSWFYHLNGVTVEAGQMVETGDQIGIVGSTGILTTGPHLHYAMTVNGAFIDPQQFMDGAFLE